MASHQHTISWQMLRKKYPRAYRAISARQRSYIDEFHFVETQYGIDAYYADEFVGRWTGGEWING